MPGFANDPMIYAVVVRARGGRAFCAGGDIRQVAALAREDMGRARQSFALEYLMNWVLECFPKPQVSLIDGLVVGSGVGLTAYGTHKVAGPGYAFAMPEVGIGLFPDVGVCHVLSRMPSNIGLYLGLTGETIGRADARALGLVTHISSVDAFDAIHERLADADPVDPLLDRYDMASAQEPTPVMARAELISDIFAGDDLAAIFARLDAAARRGGADGDWASATLATLSSRSPFSLAITLRHIRESASRPLRETLIADYRLAVACLDYPDFAEGVRALLIDKDRNPRWAARTVGDLDPAVVAAAFEARVPDLELPERDAMLRLKAVR